MNTLTTTSTTHIEMINLDEFDASELSILGECLGNIKKHVRKNIEKGSSPKQMARLLMINRYLTELQGANAQ